MRILVMLLHRRPARNSFSRNSFSGVDPDTRGNKSRMHELAITESLVEAVLERCGDARVRTVRLEIGELAGVVPDAVRFCFELVSANTSLADARLDIVEPPGRVRCRTCGHTCAVDVPILLCDCGSTDVEVLSGRELRLVSVELGELEETDGVHDVRLRPG
ncbi:MAG TPA: hydrogenase maturation nickel metallochaperone HypA [Actinopolymorphaceae bacterium]